MIAILMSMIRFMPFLETAVIYFFKNYQQWRAAYDAQKVAETVSKALKDKSTEDLNKLIGGS